MKQKKILTTFFTLEDVVKGYLTFKYGCGIISRIQSKRFPSFDMWCADGFPVITFKKIDYHSYHLQNIEGKELVNDARITYSLEDIKQMFINLLSNKEITIKEAEFV